MSMKDRFEDPAGLVEALRRQKLTLGQPEIAEAFARTGELIEFAPGSAIITQGGSDRDVYFLLSGSGRVIINGVRLPYKRSAGVTVGEMSAVNPTIRRSSTIEADETTVAWKVPHEFLAEVADAYPVVWRHLAEDLAGRVEQRNSLVNRSNLKPQIFIICSQESLDIARAIRVGLEYHADVEIWSDEKIFPPGGYPIEALEEQVGQSDFGIALAEPDDLVYSRDRLGMTPRDNVIFELGFFMARLGRHRTLLLTPRRTEVKLPSDFKGLTPLPYSIGENLPKALGPTIDRITTIVNDLGVRASLIESR